jgi:hypothetical protein
MDEPTLGELLLDCGLPIERPSDELLIDDRPLLEEFDEPPLNDRTRADELPCEELCDEPPE